VSGSVQERHSDRAIHALVAQSDSRRNTLPKVLGGDALAATAPSAAAFDVVADTGDDRNSIGGVCRRRAGTTTPAF
jgi:hypothetical protein